MAAQRREVARVVPVYQLLAEDIKALGVERVFGLISDDICQLVACLDSHGIRFYGARHETNAIVMAEGYASISGRLGIALIGRGPALANGMHGLIAASKSSSPVLVISGDAPLGSLARDALGPDLKSLAAAQMIMAAGVPVYRPVSARAAQPALADAAAEATLGKAVVLLLPMDVQVSTILVEDSPEEIDRYPKHVAPVRKPSVEAAVSLLGNASKPLIIGGIGAFRANARAAIEQLAERTGALLATSLKAKDLFRGNPYNLSIIGSSSHSTARRLIDQCDCVLTFGASLNYLTMVSGKALPNVPIIQVDLLRTNIGRWWFADVGIVGDARLVAEELAVEVGARRPEEKPFHCEEVRARISAFDHRNDFEAAHTDRTIDPRILSLELSRILPAQRNIVWDGGNFMSNWAYFDVPNPSYLKIPLDFGSVGLGIGTALGVACARPECPTVLIIGDGGLLMSMGELETSIREDLPLIVVVMNDAAYGAEVHILQAQGLPVERARFADVDFSPMAEPLGFEVATIRTMQDLKNLEPAMTKPTGPMLLDCKINGAVIAPFISEFVAH